MYRTRFGSLWTLEALIAISGLLLLMGMGVSASEVLEQWSWRNPYPNGNDLNGVAYGNGTFVAVGAGGTIMTSTDGHLWEQRESGFDKQLNQVIFTQNAFLAVGEGVILNSDNAKNWVSHPTNPLYSLRGVTFAQGKYVMVGAKGDSQQLSQIILCRGLWLKPPNCRPYETLSHMRQSFVGARAEREHANSSTAPRARHDVRKSEAAIRWLGRFMEIPFRFCVCNGALRSRTGALR